MKKKEKIFNVGRDFSLFPAGRYSEDGPYSGEKFRSKLEHHIKHNGEGTITKIELDGPRGYGSSFLEEAFGGLVRLGYSPETIFSRIELVSEDISLINEIKSYINDAFIYAEGVKKKKNQKTSNLKSLDTTSSV